MKPIHIALLAGALSTVGCGSSSSSMRSLPPRQEQASGKAFALSPSQIAARALPAVVAVKSDHGFGTGFVVRKDGLVATNFHVVAGARALSVVVPDRGEHPVVEMLVLDREMDLAVLKIEEDDLPVLSIGDSKGVHSGDAIVAIGHPLGFDHTVSNGLVSAVRAEGPLTVFQISAPIAPGSSGGPLLNERGEVIGVVTATVTAGQNLNFGVPAAYLKSALAAPKPMSFEKFAQESAKQRPPEPKHDVPHHEVALLSGCGDGELVVLKAMLSTAVHDSAEAYDTERFAMVDHVLEGASLDAERRLSPACRGPRRALGDARKVAGNKPDALAASWAMLDGFEGLAEVIDKKLKR